MDISINTDYREGQGCAEGYLRAAAEAGFTHLLWCHQWCTDFLYDDCEIAQIGDWMRRYGLKLLDIHGSVGPEKNWFSTVEYQRQAGVSLVANRLKMLSALQGSGTLVMHIPAITAETSADDVPMVWQRVSALKRSLNELLPLIQRLHVPIAVENTFQDSFEVIDNLLAAYSPEILGLCYDSGHGNLGNCRGLEHLERVKDRLIATHFHDNDGASDQHQPPFMGTLDWKRLAQIVASSPYRRPINFEVSMRCTTYQRVPDFMKDTYARCRKFVEMCAK